MIDVEIYTTMLCGFCYRAKSLLKAKNVAFREIDVTMSRRGRAEMIARAGGRTSVPQIFIAGNSIGGCDELYGLEEQGKLDSLLEAG